MNKITPGHLRAIILAMGVLLIGLGLSKAVFKVGLADETEKTISSGLFFGAAIACLYLFKLRMEEAKGRKSSADRPGAQLRPPDANGGKGK